MAACSGSDDENKTVQPAPTTEPQTIRFNLTASMHDDAATTRAVKTDWEAGDAIFVFFDNVAAPKHLKMSYDGTEWTSAEYDGATETPGALGLKNGDTGTMRAVFLPFGSSATVSANGTDFVFSKTFYAYYLTATLSYTVVDGQVSGAFNMVIPVGYVQFFVYDSTPHDENYFLGCDAVIPVGVASIAADGTITETSDKSYADDMPGYAYNNGTDKGYLFSGKLNENYSYSGYYLCYVNPTQRARYDYFITGKALVSHSAVNLTSSNKQFVGYGIKVQLEGSNSKDLGEWYTCNYDCAWPEDLGTLYNYSEAKDLSSFTGMSYDYPIAPSTFTCRLPTDSEWVTLKNGCTRTWLSLHGQEGLVLKANGNGAFLFLPAQNTIAQYPLCYFSSTEDMYFTARGNNYADMYNDRNYSLFDKAAVRPVY